MGVPQVGSEIQIKSYKHDGSLHRIWESSLVLRGTESVIIAANDKTRVTESDGRSWLTREPAITYFDSQCWFNVIGMLRDDGIYYYCNMSSPFAYDNEALKYIDYDLDVKVYPDMTHVLLDEDEYAIHKARMAYPKEMDQILYKNIDDLIRWIHERKGPFAPEFVEEWYERYLAYRSF